MHPAPLPASARFALWFSAWVTGRCSLDDARDAIVGDDAAHDVQGLPGSTGPEPLIVALGLLRGARAAGAGLALPVPGDPLGLAGPGPFNTEVLDAAEGVVLEGADLGLVPHRVGAGVVWVTHPAVSRRQLPDPSEADASLRSALLRTTDTLARLDVARWRPEVADELIGLRRTVDLALPSEMAPRAVRLASLATRCRTIVELALDDDGGSVTAAEAAARRAALVPLDSAARRALVAACTYPWDGSA
ncbi:MAG TPA: hypothetical protein VER39_07720 [Nocardioidaceae bacterium]|nr:hypothetical protein [Nocardioidaceae bacterium]